MFEISFNRICLIIYKRAEQTLTKLEKEEKIKGLPFGEVFYAKSRTSPSSARM